MRCEGAQGVESGRRQGWKRCRSSTGHLSYHNVLMALQSKLFREGALQAGNGYQAWLSAVLRNWNGPGGGAD